MLNNIPPKIRLALLAGLILILAGIGYGLYLQGQRSGKVAVTITTVPSDAMATFNGKNEGAGTVYLKEGKYEVKISKEGFADATFTQYIDRAHASIVTPLDPVSDEAKQWAKDYSYKYMELEGKAGEAAQQEGEAFRDKNPIINLLPFKNLLFTIGYSKDNSDPSGNSIILRIDAPEGYRQNALNQIKQWGYDPTEYKIKFNNYENPFKS